MKKYFLPLLLCVIALAACGERTDREPGAQPGETPDQPAAEAEQPPVQAEELFWVYRSRGDRQCEGGGTSLEESSSKLTGNGVKVHESRCGTRTDRMYPAVCGGPTGNILLHLIGRQSLDAALELGFDPASKIQYQHSDCPGNRA